MFRKIALDATHPWGINQITPLEQAGATYSSAQAGDLVDSLTIAFYSGKLIQVWADNSNSTADNPDGTGLKLDF